MSTVTRPTCPLVDRTVRQQLRTFTLSHPDPLPERLTVYTWCGRHRRHHESVVRLVKIVKGDGS